MLSRLPSDYVWIDEVMVCRAVLRQGVAAHERVAALCHFVSSEIDRKILIYNPFESHCCAEVRDVVDNI